MTLPHGELRVHGSLRAVNDTSTPPDPLTEALARVAAALAGQPGLDLLLLVGSRARGDAHTGSDWDFAYLARPEVDPAELLRRLGLALATDRVDLADLGRASVLYRHRAAVEGRRLLGTKETHDGFVIDATLTYLDMEPILRAAYASVLREATR